MLETYQLQQLATVAEHATLTEAADALGVTQPALSKSMKKLESMLGVSLFRREGGRVSLNDNGSLAAAEAREMLERLNALERRIRDRDRAARTIAVGSCAPAPLWDIVPFLATELGGMGILAQIDDNGEALEAALLDDVYQVVVLDRPSEHSELACIEWGSEHLCVALPPDHPLATRKSLRFAELDGQSVLLKTNLGVWGDVHRKLMPRSHVLLQPEETSFYELVRSSTVPSFVTDRTIAHEGDPEGRIVVPISDPEATLTFYLACRRGTPNRLEGLLVRLANQRRAEKSRDPETVGDGQ